MVRLRAFRCDKCGEYFERDQRALENHVSFDGQRGPRTLTVDLLYKCVHTKSENGYNCEHSVHFCDDCLLWLLEEYKGSIMVVVGREEENVTEVNSKCAGHRA